ncbi:hypothetical protein BN7_5826 [Wickerhamomyces ciferrii]|uniref:Uncharacterized protein n=1 Tax=Wickerhamomyces ciferrii (strain ATCC 14091 / BCRC 22168 / CBS 111 / JCM 3599 / NBRC 0793 / NRRL Y-1031 F-60-10) TaxID=1206466 RepID=K0KLU3_WICCF|nr:uncharacterized protein BN7_5826 [Wickerhamomyces ciferrii]CCH46235.1 hypothetical protein BN7_5826 [Wickerhamomyces ciferrii]
MWNGYDQEMRARYQRSKSIRRERIKQVCQVNDPVLNLSFDMIKEANTIDGDYTNHDYLHQVESIYRLFQLSSEDEDSIRNGDLVLTYDESIYNKLSWFNMSMAKPETLLINPLLDLNNSFIESLIRKLFANEHDREICRQDPYVKLFTNPSQPLRKNKLLNYHRNVVISQCSEIPLIEISKECNEFLQDSNEVQDVIEIGECISSLWYSPRDILEANSFNASKESIEQYTFLNENFMSMKDKSIQTRIEKLTRKLCGQLSSLSGVDISSKILDICYGVNLTMHKLNKNYKYLSFFRKHFDQRNYDLNSCLGELINHRLENTDIKVSSGQLFTMIGNDMMIETTRYKYLQDDFIKFINSTVREQISLKEFKVIRNLIKQAILYCKQSNSTIVVISNLSTMIILELDINGCELINVDEEKLFDVKLRYRMINLEDQYLTMRWEFVYLFKQLGKEIDQNVKDELLIQFLWKFQISDNERLQNKKAVNKGDKLPNINEGSIDNFITRPLPKIFSNIDFFHRVSKHESMYNTKKMVVIHQNVKNAFGYEIEGIPLDKKMILKVYKIDLPAFDKLEDEIQHGAFEKEVKSLEFINKHNLKCEKEGSKDAIVNVPKIYKHFIMNLKNSETKLSELHGYAILMEKIEHVDICLNPIIEDTPYLQDLERQVLVMESLGIKHNNLEELGNVVLDMNMKPFILDWGLSEINQES